MNTTKKWDTERFSPIVRDERRGTPESPFRKRLLTVSSGRGIVLHFKPPKKKITKK